MKLHTVKDRAGLKRVDDIPYIGMIRDDSETKQLSMTFKLFKIPDIFFFILLTDGKTEEYMRCNGDGIMCACGCACVKM